MLRRVCLFLCLLFPLANFAAEGKRLALLISVQECKDTRLHRLWFCDDDIQGLAGILPSIGFAPGDISLVTQRASVEKKSDSLKPSAARIRAGLQRLCKEAGPDDVVLVAFSGHGVQLKRDGRIYLCPPETLLDNPTTLLPIDEIYKTLNSHCKARVKLLLIDACRNDPTDGRPESALGLARPPEPDTPAGFAAFYSCSRGQGSFETGKLLHGVFFHHVIAGLGGEAKDVTGDITLPSLEDYLAREVPASMVKYRTNPKFNQTPRFLESFRDPLMLKKGDGAAASGVDKPIALHGAGATLSASVLSVKAAEYSKEHPAVVVDHRGANLSGVSALKSRSAHFAASDVPLTALEKFKGPTLLEIPTSSAPLAAVYNLPSVPNLTLDAALVADIFSGRIENWNDPKIAALNPSVVFPDKHIVVTHLINPHLTTLALSTYLSSISETWQKSIGSGMQVKWPVGAAALSSEELIQIVGNVEGAFGAVEMAAAEAKKLQKATLMSPILGTTYLIVYQDLTYLNSRKQAEELVNYLVWCTSTDAQRQSALKLLRSMVFDGQVLVK
jgi:ABC-type phosphate transport system substrate-binding protein